jgi:hypothetical protein
VKMQADRHKVVCQALAPLIGTSNFCDWPGGYRKGTAESAAAKPCPRCGGPVTVLR